jgi:ABC-type glycerol-3-phosphate transport system permease component
MTAAGKSWIARRYAWGSSEPAAVRAVVPSYIIFAELGWVNTFLPLIVPSFVGSAYFIFLRLPTEMEETAHIDGANAWQIL